MSIVLFCSEPSSFHGNGVWGVGHGEWLGNRPRSLVLGSPTAFLPDKIQAAFTTDNYTTVKRTIMIMAVHDSVPCAVLNAAHVALSARDGQPFNATKIQ